MPELLFIAFALMAGLSAMTLALKALLGLALLIENLLAAPVVRRRRPGRAAPAQPSEAWARA